MKKIKLIEVTIDEGGEIDFDVWCGIKHLSDETYNKLSQMLIDMISEIVYIRNRM